MDHFWPVFRIWQSSWSVSGLQNLLVLSTIVFVPVTAVYQTPDHSDTYLAALGSEVDEDSMLPEMSGMSPLNVV